MFKWNTSSKMARKTSAVLSVFICFTQSQIAHQKTNVSLSAFAVM